MSDEQFIAWAESVLGKRAEVSRERHGDQSSVYLLDVFSERYFLKIAPHLSGEKERIEWLRGKLPVPRIAGFFGSDKRDALLLSALPGRNLAALCKEISAENVVEKLATTLLAFHAIDPKGCPFGNGEGILIHGDACLPNFIFNGDEFSGYIDLGDVRIGDRAVDLAAAVWSLNYNIGPGYGTAFLAQYGIADATDATEESLRKQYEEMQKKWGLEDKKSRF